MNCLEFRREALIAPSDLSEEASIHELGCTACADLVRRLRAMDARLAEGFSVPAPASLAERAIAATLPRPNASRRRFLASAAGMTLAAGVGMTAYWQSKDDPLALAGISFVVEEEANAILHAPPSDRATLLRVTDQMRLALPAQLGEIRYVGTCPFQGTIAHHVIVTTPQGKATLLWLPEMPVESMLTAAARGLRARVIPAAMGSVAVIAGSERNIDRIDSYLGRI